MLRPRKRFSAAARLASQKVSNYTIRNDFNKTKVYRCPNAKSLKESADIELPHIMLVGKTNVGKSSLLNNLLKKKNLARTSSRAAKTKTVDLFCVNESLVIADTPGFATAEGELTRLWDSSFFPLIRYYVEQCVKEKLRLLLIVQDINQHVTERESEFIRLFRKWNLPTLLVLTKDDKILSHRQRVLRTRNIKAKLEITGPHVHYTIDKNPSSRRARRALLRYINDIVHAEDIQACHAILSANKTLEKPLPRF